MHNKNKNKMSNTPEDAPTAASLPQVVGSDAEGDESSALMPDPDVDFHVDVSDDPTAFVKPGKEGLEKKSGMPSEPQYILGTLVVRVVAARDLEPVNKRGIDNLFGAKKRFTGQGTANPYASVKFGNSTQRSSEVYDTLDPIWPRQEAMFMDVSLPASKVAHPDTSQAAISYEPTESSTSQDKDIYEKPSTILTVALFHAAEIGRASKIPSNGVSGDSNDMFLGMASIDLQRLFTGREHTFDGWLQLSGTETSRGSVRLVCEYEPSDPPPRSGDYCRFTRFCHPQDLYPLHCGRQYRILEVEGDTVLISYTTPEGWVCTFQAHQFMLICEERHHSNVEVAQDEFASMAERFTHSPMVHSINETVERVAVDGLLDVGEQVARSGFNLFNRWFSGGFETVVDDLANATNWDGRYNPDTSGHLNLPNLRSAEAGDDGTNGGSVDADERMETKMPALSHVQLPSMEPEALPNMPACPITGFPMIDPVVAADGHTYERSAISRWLTTSNMSPMTGSVLPHKELVTNYGLLSSVQEAANQSANMHFGKSDIPTKIEVHESESVAPSGLFSLDEMETVAMSPTTAYAEGSLARAERAGSHVEDGAETQTEDGAKPAHKSS